MDWLPPARPQPGIEPSTQTDTLTGNLTGNFLVDGTVSTQ